MNILCIFNNSKSIQYIFDSIIKLSKNNKIFYYLNHQMSIENYKSNNLYANKIDDIRFNLINILNKNNCINIPKNLNNLIFFLKIYKIDITIIDDSNGIEKGNTHGYNKIYKIIKLVNENIKVIGNIEGVKDFNVKINKTNKKNTELESIKNSINVCYDYIFCFSKYQFDILNENLKLKNKIFKIGIPYLDKLKNLKPNVVKDKYMILFTSVSRNCKSKWDYLPDNYILEIIKLAKKLNFKLIIKEKPKKEYSYKYLENENIKVTMCHDDTLNDLILNSSLILSVPSSIVLRCLFLNKNTIILNDKYYGQLGNLKDYKCLINEFNTNLIEENIQFLKNNKNYIRNFIKENYYGYDFNSCDLFIKSVYNINLLK